MPYNIKCKQGNTKHKGEIKMLDKTFGLEIEMTGITRCQAAKIACNILGGKVVKKNDYYDTYSVVAPDGRKWNFMSDGSIMCYTSDRRPASKLYSVEFVTPPCLYREDMETIQEIVRALKAAGAWCPPGTGIHVHLDGAAHTPASLRRFINIIGAKGDLLYEALEIPCGRRRWCQKLEANLLEEVNAKKPKSFSELEDIWYKVNHNDLDRTAHYNHSRYHLLNLHSYFNMSHHTVEIRAFNSTLHAGKIRAYVVLALAINNQALTQRSARLQKPMSNHLAAMTNWLRRIGLNDPEFENCVKHLTNAFRRNRTNEE